MPFSVSNNRILISGNETLATFATWASSNSQAIRHDSNVVEANSQIKLQNGANFDTSLGTLIINHRLEGQNNNAQDSGIWKCHGGCIIQQGGRSNFAEWWAIMDFDRAHFISNKTGGQQAFFRSNASATGINIRNSTFIHNAGGVDGHLQFSAGTGTITNTYFESKTGNTAFLLVRDSDSDGVSLIGIDLGGWNDLTQPTTFHKNMTFDHGTGANARKIVYYYRRNNYPIFYNPVNQGDGERMTTIAYQPLGSSGTGGRGIIVGKFEPVLEDQNGNLLDDVNVEIRKVSDSSVEHTATTDVTGKVEISGDTHSLSWNGRDIDEAGILYVKQSITPATSGAIDSVDQGTFRIRMRRRDLQSFEATQAFTSDFDGVKIIASDELYTAGNELPTITDETIVDAIYNVYKLFLEQNINSDLTISRVGNTLLCVNDIIIDPNTSENFFNGETIFIKASKVGGNISTTETVTRLNGADVNGSIKDSNGLIVAVSGLPATGVAGAWLKSQGTNNRAGIITARQSNGTVKLQLQADTEYYFVADAIGYARSAVAELNTTTHSSATVNLQRIKNAAGDDLVPDTLTAQEQQQVAMITFDALIFTAVVNATPALHNFTFNAIAYYIESVQSSATFLASPTTIAIRQGEFVLDPNSEFKLGASPDATATPDFSAFTFRKEGTTDQTDFVDFSNGALIVNSGAPVIVTGITVEGGGLSEDDPAVPGDYAAQLNN